MCFVKVDILQYRTVLKFFCFGRCIAKSWKRFLTSLVFSFQLSRNGFKHGDLSLEYDTHEGQRLTATTDKNIGKAHIKILDN